MQAAGFVHQRRCVVRRPLPHPLVHVPCTIATCTTCGMTSCASYSCEQFARFSMVVVHRRRGTRTHATRLKCYAVARVPKSFEHPGE